MMTKILLVDDNLAGGDVLSRRLRLSGYEVVSAADEVLAVSMAAEERPDVILMDLNRPLLDGWAASRRIKGDPVTRAIPVIAITPHPLRDHDTHPDRTSCDDYDTRPVDLPRLLGKIEACVKTVVTTPADAPITAPSGAPAWAERETPLADSAAGVAPRGAVDTGVVEAGVATRATGRLLIVDDTPANLDVLARRLRRDGYMIDTAADGLEALRRVAATSYDLVLLDTMMPGMNGIEVLDAIRKKYPPTTLPVIMVTALDGPANVVRAFEHGANDYVTKPLDFEVVLARVHTQLSLKHAIDQIRRLEHGLQVRNRELEAASARTERDLDAAVKVQAALMPGSSPIVPGYRFAWEFHPSAQLAGDIFNVFRLDDRYVGLYVLDVSGHGVAAALLSVTVSRFLFPIPDPTSLLWERSADGECHIASPAYVARRLSERFPFDNATSQFFTLVYGLLDLKENAFRYVCAGHPPVIHHRQGGEATLLRATGYPIGVGTGEYEEKVVQLMTSDRLYLYSDGIPETSSPTGEMFGGRRMADTLSDAAGEAPDVALGRLSDALNAWSGDDRGKDDRTILCLEREPDTAPH